MYDKTHMSNTNSGIFYSCISNEIIPIIPTECDYIKNIIALNSYEEADNIDEFVQAAAKIINLYPNYLKCAKISSKKLKSIIDNGSIVRNIN